jgi:hypothetical protein
VANHESKNMINGCLDLMKVYLNERKISYDKVVDKLSDERKKKMKASKGL